MIKPIFTEEVADAIGQEENVKEFLLTYFKILDSCIELLVHIMRICHEEI